MVSPKVTELGRGSAHYDSAGLMAGSRIGSALIAGWLALSSPAGRIGSSRMNRQRSPDVEIGALRHLADEDLMALVQAADAAAFEVLYERHAAVVYSLAYRIMGTAGAAEDVTQEALLSAWRGAGRYDRSRGSARTWLLGIVHHRAIDALRRRGPSERREVDSEGIAERLESPQRTDEQVASAEQASSLRELLAQLPVEQRKVIELAYFGGFTHTEIAAMLDVPLGTVKGRMRLALERLRGVAGPLEAGR